MGDNKAQQPKTIAGLDAWIEENKAKGIMDENGKYTPEEQARRRKILRKIIEERDKRPEGTLVAQLIEQREAMRPKPCS